MARPLSIVNAPWSTSGAGRPASSTSARREAGDAVDRRGHGRRSRQHGHAAMAQAHEQPPELAARRPRNRPGRRPTSRPAGRRSTTTSGTPRSRHRRTVSSPVPAGTTSRPSTCRCSSIGTSRRSSSSRSSLLARSSEMPASRAAVSTPCASVVKNGFVMSGRTSAIVSVRLGPEVAGERVGHVAGLRERLLDAGTELGADRPGAVDHPGHGHGRDPGAPGDVAQGRHAPGWGDLLRWPARDARRQLATWSRVAGSPRSAGLDRAGSPACGRRCSTTYSIPCARQNSRFSGWSPSSLTT